MVHKHTSTFRWSVNWGADEGVVVVVEYMGSCWEYPWARITVRRSALIRDE